MSKSAWVPKLKQHIPGKHSPHTHFSPYEYYTWNNWWRVYRLSHKMEKPLFKEFQTANARRGDAGFVSGVGISYTDKSMRGIYSRLLTEGNCAPSYVLKYCKDPYSAKSEGGKK